MAILVLGGAGYIGSHAVYELIATVWKWYKAHLGGYGE